MSKSKKKEASKAWPEREFKIRQARVLRKLIRTDTVGEDLVSELGGPVTYIDGHPYPLDLDYKPLNLVSEACKEPSTVRKNLPSEASTDDHMSDVDTE